MIGAAPPGLSDAILRTCLADPPESDVTVESDAISTV